MEDFLFTEAELRGHAGAKWSQFPPDVLPAWVAEMDFRVAPAVQAAVRLIVDTEDYGYGGAQEPSEVHRFYDAFAGWMSRRHGWAPDPELTVGAADVIQGIAAAIHAFSQPGDGVITQTPIYPPFLRTIELTRRTLVENPLRDTPSRFELDLEGLEAAASRARVLLWCSPHNPTGRIFSRDEQAAVAEIAARHDLLIVSDEIHADLVHGGARHVPMATLPAAAERTVTVTSATKGFNIPGLRAAVMQFGTTELRTRFEDAVGEFLLGGLNRLGVAATIAAWTDGEEWLGRVLQYLEVNRGMVADWAQEVGLPHHAPEATYLAWLDCRGLDLAEGVSPQQHLLERARVGLSDGADFGPPGRGFVRLNFATSRDVLAQVLERITAAVT